MTRTVTRRRTSAGPRAAGRHRAPGLAVMALLALRGACPAAPAVPAERPAGPSDLVRDILACEQEQQRVTTMTSTVAGRIADLLKTVRANRAGDADSLARWEEALRELTALSQQNMVRSATALERARRAPSEEAVTHLRAASLEQREILSRLLALLRAIEQRVAFARLVDDLEQLIRDQAEVKEGTAAAARQALGKPAEQLSAAERERLGDLKDEQDVLGRAWDRLNADLQALKATDAAGSTTQPAAAPELAAVKRAAERAARDRPDRDLHQAAAALAERRPLEAAGAQDRALDKLRNLHHLLRQDDAARLRRLEAAAAQLDQLIKDQRQTRRDTTQLKPDSPLPDIERTLKAQNQVTQGTGAVAKAAAALSPEAANALSRAQAAQRTAEGQLTDRRPEPAAQSQQQAVERMQEAKAALDSERRRLVDRLAEPSDVARMERAAADLDRLIQDQEQARQASEKMADEADAGRPAQPADLERAAAGQRDLAESTRAAQRRLAQEQAMAAAAALDAATPHQDAAARDLDRAAPREAAADQQKAVDQLRRAAAQLADDVKLAREAQAQEAARRQALERQAATLDALQQALDRMRDLDQLIARQRDLRDESRDLGERMAPKPGQPAMKPPEARAAAQALADRQRAVETDTGRVGDALDRLDRDAARAVDEAQARQAAAADRLDRAEPKAAVPEEEKAVEHLQAARQELGRKVEQVAAALRELKAEQEALAQAPPGPEAGEPKEQPGLDDLAELAEALSDLGDLRAGQEEMKAATESQAARAGHPGQAADPKALQALARRQEAHAEATRAVGERLEGLEQPPSDQAPDAQASVAAAEEAMRLAAQGLGRQTPAPAAAEQARAIRNLDQAMSAVGKSLQSAAVALQNNVQAQRQQHSTDPKDYDPMGRPPGSLGPQDTLARRRWNVNLPPRLREDIMAVLGDPFPAGFEELLRRYYEDLSEEAWERLDLRKPR